MREDASKAATEDSTVGLLRDGDDIASLRAVTPPLIHLGGYRVRSRPPRLIRAAAIAPVASKPMPVRRSFTALFAGAFSLAVLTGPVTCPTCTPVHAYSLLDVDRIAAPVLTAAISPAPDHMLNSAPAAVATSAAANAGKLPDTTQELTDKGQPQVEIAAATVESQPKPPLSPAANTTLPSKNITAVKTGTPRRDLSIKRRRAKARIPADKYSQAPAWAAKMFETNWQDKAFAYQYD
jgi:hypothetical protein